MLFTNMLVRLHDTATTARNTSSTVLSTNEHRLSGVILREFVLRKLDDFGLQMRE